MTRLKTRPGERWEAAASAHAATLAAPGRFEIEPVELPAPGAGQVLVRMESCGALAAERPAGFVKAIVTMEEA